MANAHRIARECGITLHGRGHHHPASTTLPRRHTWSRDAIKRIALSGERAGRPEHVYDVLTLLVSRSSGEVMLFGDVIKGTSEWMRANRVTSHEVPFLADHFADVDLVGSRDIVKRYKLRERPVQIAFLISAQMEPALEQLRA